MFAMMLAIAAQAAVQTESVTGRWLTETRHGIVEIAPCGNSICGQLVTSDTIRANALARDDKNKDAALRQRLLKGLPMLQGFHGSGARWDNGSVYNPDDGGTYHGTLTLVDPGTMKVRGCIVWPLCKSQLWKRVN